jgi:hypothetical protein
MYGASYKGSGVVTHKLSLYRHICNINNTIIYDKKIGDVNEISKNETKNGRINLNFESSKKFQNLKLKNGKKNNFRRLKNENKSVSTDLNFYDDMMNHNSKLLTSLVFGAGTVQWSYALSDFHDGTYQPEDLYLQQATINLLADMDVQPASLDGGKRNILKVAFKSTDYVPPRSTIDYPLNGSIFIFKNEKKLKNEIKSKGINMGSSFVIKGRSKDHGGGHVTGISISY